MEKRPSTLNLQDRAKQAINCLTRNVDAERGYQIYFMTSFGNFYYEEPKLHHHYWDYADGTGRFVDALILARIMTGSHFNEDVDQHLRSFLTSLIKEDGLSWCPKAPWTPGEEAELYSQRSTLMGLVSWYLLTKDREVKRCIESMVEGLWRIAIKEKDYCYYPSLRYRQGGWEKTPIAFEKTTGGLAGWYGALVMPLLRYYEETESQGALQLLENLTRYTVHYSKDFGKDGSFHGHFHSKTATTAAILRYALLFNKSELVDWARRVYGYALSLGSSFGWFPENVENKEGCETCCITDMIDIAIMLGEAGYEEYWNYVERFTRNHLVESQLLDVEWIKSIEENPTLDLSCDVCSTPVDAAERVKGGFAGWSAPNDFIGRKLYTLMHCCTAHGVRALYLVWHHIVTRKDDEVYVNLALSRDTEWVEVISYQPYEGKVELIIHEAPKVLVRIPDWTEKEKVEVKVDEKRRGVEWKNSYVKVTGLSRGEKVTVTYPMKHCRVKETVAGNEYLIEWRGDTVLSISPEGRIHPLYQRSWMQGETPLTEGLPYRPQKELPP